MNVKYSYQDIILEPNYSECVSRSDLDPSVELGGRRFKIGVIPSNMESVINFKLANWLSNHGYFYVSHRFGQNLDHIKRLQSLPFVSISVGCKKQDENDILIAKHALWKIDYVCLDIAMGWSANAQRMLKFIKEYYPKAFVIVGNVGGNEKCIKDLESWGADAIKLGHSMGFACSSYDCTGVGTPMFSTVLEAASYAKVPLIADGQVRKVGDICKSYVAGAKFAMVGSLFAKCSDSAAPVENGKKCYFGSASARSKGHSNFVEGKETYLDIGETYEQTLKRMEDGIRSAMSYGNCKSITDFRKVKWSVLHNQIT